MDVLKYLGSVQQSFLWANLIWGTVASGYLIYGWKQKMLIPFVGGLLMLAVSCFTAPAAHDSRQHRHHVRRLVAV